MYINEPNNDYYAIDAHPPMINANQAHQFESKTKRKKIKLSIMASSPSFVFFLSS